MVVDVFLSGQGLSQYIPAVFLTKHNHLLLLVVVLMIFCVAEGTVKPCVAFLKEISLLVEDAD
jgi:hypothetical protein